jgi:hypothetical protein
VLGLAAHILEPLVKLGSRRQCDRDGYAAEERGDDKRAQSSPNLLG